MPLNNLSFKINQIAKIQSISICDYRGLLEAPYFPVTCFLGLLKTQVVTWNRRDTKAAPICQEHRPPWHRASKTERPPPATREVSQPGMCRAGRASLNNVPPRAASRWVGRTWVPASGHGHSRVTDRVAGAGCAAAADRCIVDVCGWGSWVHLTYGDSSVLSASRALEAAAGEESKEPCFFRNLQSYSQ